MILVGRVAPPVGPAEETLCRAELAVAAVAEGTSRQRRARTPIPGTGRQETWVRVYLPVK